MSALYDTIGVDYANLRQPDPRIAAQIEAALGDARSVLNVGAGAGSYEPADRTVTALEPSAEMIAQRPPDAAPAVQGSAEHLPFADRSFDAVMGVLTIHHWPDQAQGLREMRRVARERVVLLTESCDGGEAVDKAEAQKAYTDAERVIGDSAAGTEERLRAEQAIELARARLSF